VLATIVRQLHRLPYYRCEAKCLTLNHDLLLLFVGTQFEIGDNQSSITKFKWLNKLLTVFLSPSQLREEFFYP
jgi:hypothetical protein